MEGRKYPCVCRCLCLWVTEHDGSYRSGCEGSLRRRREAACSTSGSRLRSNHRRLFEKLGRVPAGYVALGDAICSFNPFYGHGMTVAVQEAVALGTALGQHGNAGADMARGYYQAAAAVIAGPWQIAVDGDFAYAETSGPRPRGAGLRNSFANRLMLASQVVPESSPIRSGTASSSARPRRT
jgi:2-polyprenyl-6-methoxyphenol hydroxylase-like FAD-dependent oxidoreductase